LEKLNGGFEPKSRDFALPGTPERPIQAEDAGFPFLQSPLLNTTPPIQENEKFEVVGDVESSRQSTPLSPWTGNASSINQNRTSSIAESYSESFISFDTYDSLSIISSVDGNSMYEGRQSAQGTHEVRRKGRKRNVHRNANLVGGTLSGEPSMQSFKSQDSLAPSFMGGGAQVDPMLSRRSSRSVNLRSQIAMRRWKKVVTLSKAASAFSQGKKPITGFTAPQSYTPELFSRSNTIRDIQPSSGSSTVNHAAPMSISHAQPSAGRESPNYFCTICPPDKRQAFATKFGWQRHEAAVHANPEYWICNAHVHPDSIAPLSHCPYTGVENPSDEHLAMYFHSTCVEKPLEDRIFFRKQGLEQHLKNHHKISKAGGVMKDAIESWWRLTPVESLREFLHCPHSSCGDTFDSWDARMSHVAGHFEGRYPTFGFSGLNTRAPTISRH
jgi:hypothetical protein